MARETVIIDGLEHTIDTGTGDCFDCLPGYPKPCPSCGGWIHCSLSEGDGYCPSCDFEEGLDE